MRTLKVQAMSLVLLTALVIGAAVSAEAKKLFVANNGLDSATCGTAISPCRSISQAITNAVASDNIMVGPGSYGDLNGDGKVGPGDETNSAGCACMTFINKPLTIESRDGAVATVIEGFVAPFAVRISSNNVVFGKPKKGFLVTHGVLIGIVVDQFSSAARVSGNIATNTGIGFAIDGTGEILSSNVSTNNDRGFSIDANQSFFAGNIAKANLSSGFEIAGEGNTFVGNIATNNSEDGFSVEASGMTFSGNLAYGNHFHGVFITNSTTGHVLTGNSFIGNRIFGVYLTAGTSATVTKNNFYGNSPAFGTFTNCGLVNNSGNTINATNNFWGVATGPGALTSPQPEPADNVCDDPNMAGNATNFAPFATKEFKVKTLTPLEDPGLIVPADPEQGEIPQAASLTPVHFLKEMKEKNALVFRTSGDVSALRLEVTDLSGKKIYDSNFVKGQTLSWTRVNAKSQLIAKGVYLYQLTARDRDGKEIRSELRKLIIENFFE